MKPTPADIQRALAELRRRNRPPVMTLAAIANGHVKQLAFMADPARFVVALCARRVGKTFGIAGLFMLVASTVANQNLLYIALSRPHAKKIMWTEIWKPMLSRWLVEGEDYELNEAELSTHFLKTGSHVYMGGTDDTRHIESFLGFRISIVVIDESQSQADTVLVPLCTRILPQAIRGGGRLILTGTVPDVPAGFFYRTWQNSKWSRHTFAQPDNPHLPDWRKELDEYLEANPGMTEDDPQIRRDVFGEMVFSPENAAFRYLEDLNSYAPPAPTCEHISIGIDPGTRDRTAIVVSGWSDKFAEVYELAEWVTPRDSGTAWSDIKRQLAIYEAQFGDHPTVADFGGSKMTLDVWQRETGTKVIEAAKKVDLIGQVDRANALLVAGRAKIIAGSHLEMDLRRARWDLKHRASGRFVWTKDVHPDVADAWRYSLQRYFDDFVATKAKTPEELTAEQDRAEIEAAFPGEPINYGPPEDDTFNLINGGQRPWR